MLAKKRLKITCFSVVITCLAVISSLLTKAGTNNIPSPQPTFPLNYKAQQLGHENLSLFFRLSTIFIFPSSPITLNSVSGSFRGGFLWSMEQNPASKHSNLKPPSWFSVKIAPSVEEENNNSLHPQSDLQHAFVKGSSNLINSGRNTLG